MHGGPSPVPGGPRATTTPSPPPPAPCPGASASPLASTTGEARPLAVSLLHGTSPAVRLANLELSPAGAEPGRRAAALLAVGDVLGDDARLDAQGLAAWSLLAAGDVRQALG